MPRYVSLINWTQQGIADFKQTVDRSEAVGQLLDQLGARLIDIYWTIGEYDIVVVVEAPDDETGTAALLTIGAQGNVRSKTMRAFTAEEMQGVLQKAP